MSGRLLGHAFMVGLFVAGGVWVMEHRDDLAVASPAGSSSSRGCPTEVDGWDREQVKHATTITRVARDVDMPHRHQAVVVALATAMQESNLTNHGHLGADNDHDSLGLFQQRPSQGWGTAEQVRDPEYAAREFFDALDRVDGWEHMRITDAAQAVQRSAHPERYQKHAGKAKKLAKALRGCR